MILPLFKICVTAKYLLGFSILHSFGLEIIIVSFAFKLLPSLMLMFLKGVVAIFFFNVFPFPASNISVCIFTLATLSLSLATSTTNCTVAEFALILGVVI